MVSEQVEQLWKSARFPPLDSRTVIMRFAGDETRACKGFFWSAEQSWYKSEGSKAKKDSVHPLEWREVSED